MIEAAVVFDHDGRAIHWPGHAVNGPGYIPDSRSLWDVVWENREVVAGIAHTHPGSGNPTPSPTDISTFDAIEAGLGRQLVWPIVTLDQVAFFLRYGDAGYLRTCVGFSETKYWNETINELRRLSQMGG